MGLLETIFCRSCTLCIWLDSEPTKLLDHPKQKSRKGGGLMQINTGRKVPLKTGQVGNTKFGHVNQKWPILQERWFIILCKNLDFIPKRLLWYLWIYLHVSTGKFGQGMATLTGEKVQKCNNILQEFVGRYKCLVWSLNKFSYVFSGSWSTAPLVLLR